MEASISRLQKELADSKRENAKIHAQLRPQSPPSQEPLLLACNSCEAETSRRDEKTCGSPRAKTDAWEKRVSFATEDVDKPQSDNRRLKAVWQDHSEIGKHYSRSNARLTQVFNLTDYDDNDLAAELSGLHRFLINPGSNRRMVWDLFGALLLAYDFVIIPMQVFGEPTNVFSLCMEWVTSLFWTADLISCFFTGYVHKGVSIMEPSMIIRNYLRTWFFADCIVVLPDWIFTILSMVGSSDIQGNHVKTLRYLRGIRIIRLTRLAKLRRIFEQLSDRVNSEFVFIIVKIVKLLLFMVAVNHYICCMWFLISTSANDSGLDSWVVHGGFDKLSYWYQYLTSLHWSLTQFTPGSMSVQPMNSGERGFSILVLLSGMVIFSSFISSITAAMTQLRGLKEYHNRQFWLLRRYLRQNNVPRKLSIRIHRFVEYAMRHTSNQVPKSDVKAILLLSDQLRNELECLTSMRHLTSHPLFKKISESHLVVMRRLFSTTGQVCIASGDALFYIGDEPTHMHSIAYGEVQYYPGHPLGEQRQAVGGDWASEHIMWMKWTYVGTLQAQTEVDLITVNAEQFSGVIVAHLAVYPRVQKYAINFLDYVLEMPEEELSDVFLQEGARQLPQLMKFQFGERSMTFTT
eukprot:TRINITY_DN23161_c0_g1_i1.p1 TRINITY_DN23161_c0_g1~~TRINITY_DN23161_c0_g1_i1.p1  ORF type:complete len:741 (+),score=99.28 TRINITY_DN23161_c0_g1_i1:333-2225(+)